MKRITYILAGIFLVGIYSVNLKAQSSLELLVKKKDFVAKRVSSHDRSGGNADALQIKAGETRVLAEIEGPGIITHIWNTIAAEDYYSRKIVLRIYWDGETDPSVEAPIGDFFAVGHGIDRTVQSVPVAITSNGRARNCYWQMPFRESAKVTIVKECQSEIRNFYFYIDYKKLNSWDPDCLYFHAKYRQETPCCIWKGLRLFRSRRQGALCRNCVEY